MISVIPLFNDDGAEIVKTLIELHIICFEFQNVNANVSGRGSGFIFFPQATIPPTQKPCGRNYGWAVVWKFLYLNKP